MVKELKYDVERAIQDYMPSMYNFLPNTLSKKQWLLLSTNLESKISERKEHFLENSFLKVEANFYDLIVATYQYDESAFYMLNYIDVLFKKLMIYLNDDERIKLKNTVYSVLTNLDHKYLNFVGELSILSNLMGTGTYRLAGVETGIICGKKTADFTLKSKEDNCRYLVEVLNIHLYEKDKHPIDIITNKLTDKVLKKTNGQPDYNQFYLYPVLWGNLKELRIVSEFYNSGGKIDVPHVEEPYAHRPFISPDFPLIHAFSKLSTLFNDGEITVELF